MKINKKNYESVLNGLGENDYEKYMKIPELLSLQCSSNRESHTDEILFQITHQTTELWLKLSNQFIDQTIKELQYKKIQNAVALINKSNQCIKIITYQLEILTYLTPHDFAKIRGLLGNGSGLESPGWKNLRKLGSKLSKEFSTLVPNPLELEKIYIDNKNGSLFNLSEALISWDELISLWRTRHYKIAIRTIGHNTIGTKGTSVDKLRKLIDSKFFPQIWSIRTNLIDQTYGS